MRSGPISEIMPQTARKSIKGRGRLQGAAQDLLERARCADEVLEQFIRPTHNPREVATVCERKLDGVLNLVEALREVAVDGPSARSRQRLRFLFSPSGRVISDKGFAAHFPRFGVKRRHSLELGASPRPYFVEGNGKLPSPGHAGGQASEWWATTCAK